MATKPQNLIIMCGHPGAGKTTTAHRIRQKLDDTIVVSRDYFRNPYRGNGGLDAFSYGDGEIVDRRFYAPAEELLSIYTTLILDATFRMCYKRQEALTFAKEHGCKVIIVQCICSASTLLKRLQKQVALGQKRFIKSPKEVLEYYIKNTQPPENELISVNFIQLDTEKNKIVFKSLQDHSCQFVKQLIEILEQPFDPSLLESFCTNFR